MLVALAGLPATGKSTLARALASRLNGIVLDKDHLRAQLFPPSHVDYSWEQDDFCVDLLCRTAGWLLDRDPATVVLLDGCTFTRIEHIELLHLLCTSRGGVDSFLLECTCPEAVALNRLHRDRTAGNHPAENRTPELYRVLKATAETVPEPKLVLDTTQSVAHCVQQCLNALRRTPLPVDSSAPGAGRTSC